MANNRRRHIGKGRPGARAPSADAPESGLVGSFPRGTSACALTAAASRCPSSSWTGSGHPLGRPADGPAALGFPPVGDRRRGVVADKGQPGSGGRRWRRLWLVGAPTAARGSRVCVSRHQTLLDEKEWPVGHYDALVRLHNIGSEHTHSRSSCVLRMKRRQDKT